MKDQNRYYINDNQIIAPTWAMISLPLKTVELYNKKYQIKNYNGNFSLKISPRSCCNEYQLYYNDKLLLFNMYREMELYIAMERLLSGINLDTFFFEHKIKKEAFMEFLQYLYWDIIKSSLWLIEQFRKEFQSSDINLNPPNIFIVRKGNFYKMYYGTQLVRELYYSLECIHAIKVLTIEGLVGSSNLKSVVEDYQNFRKFILNSSNEELIAWMDQNKDLDKM